MRTLDWQLIRSGEGLVLVTAKFVGQGAILMAADFRDTHALVFVPTESYVGMDAKGVLRLGRGPTRLVDGIWRVDADDAANARYQNVPLGESDVALEWIR